jgi:hypothetical protein
MTARAVDTGKKPELAVTMNSKAEDGREDDKLG